MAKVISINISRKRGTIKEALQEGVFIKGFGLEGDAHGGDWHRQVSLLGNESIDKMRGKEIELSPGVFAENITTDGINLYELPIGTLLKIGESLHKVTQIGKTCHNACEIRTIVGDCVMPREGIFTVVMESGTVKIGDAIELITPESL
jgi:MOSC domain-containing protein YiiM